MNDSFCTFVLPCHSELRALMIELGYGTKDADAYVLYCAEEQRRDHSNGLRKHTTISREQIISKMSRAFTFFAGLAGVDATNKALKKTHITELRRQLPGEIHSITDHAGEEILNDHYVNIKRVRAERMKEFQMFKNVV